MYVISHTISNSQTSRSASIACRCDCNEVEERMFLCIYGDLGLQCSICKSVLWGSSSDPLSTRSGGRISWDLNRLQHWINFLVVRRVRSLMHSEWAVGPLRQAYRRIDHVTSGYKLHPFSCRLESPFVIRIAWRVLRCETSRLKHAVVPYVQRMVDGNVSSLPSRTSLRSLSKAAN